MRWMGIVIWREIVGKEGCNVLMRWMGIVIWREIVGKGVVRWRRLMRWMGIVI